jgi:hypothetical protein
MGRRTLPLAWAATNTVDARAGTRCASPGRRAPFYWLRLSMNALSHVARAGQLVQSRYRALAPLQVRAISQTRSGPHEPDVGCASQGPGLLHARTHQQ